MKNPAPCGVFLLRADVRKAASGWNVRHPKSHVIAKARGKAGQSLPESHSDRTGRPGTDVQGSADVPEQPGRDRAHVAGGAVPDRPAAVRSGPGERAARDVVRSFGLAD